MPQLFAIEADGTGLRQLTSDETLKTAMVSSPDGTHVAFAALESDRQMGEQDLTSIFSIALDGSDQRRLCAECSRTFYSQVPGPGVTIDNAGAQDFMVPDSLAWSPDGTRIAAPATSNGLLIVDVADGSTRVIDTEEPVTAIAWSPDGNMIAASHTWFLAPYNALGEMAPTSGTWWYESEERAARPGGIYVIGVNSGSVEDVVSTPGLAHLHGWTGRLLAYTRIAGHGKHAELAAYSVKDRRSWTLVPAERGSADQGAAWSPNGDRFAALIEQFDEESDPMVWTATASGEDAESAPACAFERAVEGPCYVPGIVWSPKGDAVAYRANIQQTPWQAVLVVRNVGSSDVRLIELPKLSFDVGGSYCCLAWIA